MNENFFKNKKNGVFLDVGAHDGVRFSNTYFFEKELGWTGICLEPLPQIFEQLKKNRSCICLCAAASPEDNIYKEFLSIKGEHTMLSGIFDKYNLQHRENLLFHLPENEIIKVQCRNVNCVLEEYGFSHIDFLSLDTEGGELDILKSIDFSKYQIDIMTIEDNFKDPEFITFLESKGFKFVAELKQDKIFVNTNWKP